MRKVNFWLVYALTLAVQLLISNLVGISPLVGISLLPVMILCLPGRIGTIPGMLVAFATGLAVDLLADGLPGLNALALVPVAALRRPIIGMVFGSGLFARGEDFSARHGSYGKVFMALLLSQLVFCTVYVWADSGFPAFRWDTLLGVVLSTAAGVVVSLFAIGNLAPDSKR